VPGHGGREAVNLYHGKGTATARGYLHSLKVGQWANHTNSSMTTSNINVLSGFEAYVTAGAADGSQCRIARWQKPTAWW
jgi:hypothetical protein